MTVERRKFKRHAVPESMVYVFDHDSSEMAIVKNISIDGLKFEKGSQAHDMFDWHQIDIICNHVPRFHLFGIACRLIYCIDELAENKMFTGSRSRASGLRFLDLTGDQQNKLISFLDHL